jgi:hypothetical protein
VTPYYEDARDTIINCWEQWERGAGEEEARAGGDAWFDFMNSQIESVLYGMLDRLPDIREV